MYPFFPFLFFIVPFSSRQGRREGRQGKKGMHLYVFPFFAFLITVMTSAGRKWKHCKSKIRTRTSIDREGPWSMDGWNSSVIFCLVFFWQMIRTTTRRRDFFSRPIPKLTPCFVTQEKVSIITTHKKNSQPTWSPTNKQEENKQEGAGILQGGKKERGRREGERETRRMGKRRERREMGC